MFRCNFYCMTIRAAGAFACAYLLALSAQARVTKFVAEQSSAAGAAMAIRGHFEGELDPKDKHNSLITDIQLAPRNVKGMVEYSATFSMVFSANSNGVLYYSVPNRGNGSPSSTDGNI